MLPTQLCSRRRIRPPLSPSTALSLHAAALQPLRPPYNLLQNVPTRSGENPSTHTENILEGLENSIWLDNQLDYSFRGGRRKPFKHLILHCQQDQEPLCSEKF